MKKRLKTQSKIYKIISKIQNVRNKNNVNWMDILRLATKHAPQETIELMKKINTQDKKIASLFKKIKK